VASLKKYKEEMDGIQSHAVSIHFLTHDILKQPKKEAGWKTRA